MACNYTAENMIVFFYLFYKNYFCIHCLMWKHHQHPNTISDWSPGLYREMTRRPTQTYWPTYAPQTSLASKVKCQSAKPPQKSCTWRDVPEALLQERSRQGRAGLPNTEYLGGRRWWTMHVVSFSPSSGCLRTLCCCIQREWEVVLCCTTCWDVRGVLVVETEI